MPKSEELLTAVIWDFDGTLVDTRAKNLAVTRSIIAALTGRPPDSYPVLTSLDNYEHATRVATNWRHMYGEAFGFDEAEIDCAGSMWAEYQVKDDTAAQPFSGISEVLAAIQQVPHGIVSQNAHQSITKILTQAGLLHHFQCIIGYEEVPLSRQKPEPDGLLMCLESLTSFAPGVALYIGDHEVDARCASRANHALDADQHQVSVAMVAAAYAGNGRAGPWTVVPDYTASRPSDIIYLAADLL
jgi:HAD superfamily hydrolase (TIGR01549 family)